MLLSFEEKPEVVSFYRKSFSTDPIAVIGAGAWGTAIAIALARGGHRVSLCARRTAHAGDMAVRRENIDRLPGHAFPHTLSVTPSISDAVDGAGVVFLAVPSAGIEDAAKAAAAAAVAPDVPFILCAKGLARDGRLLTDVVEQCRPGALTLILSGPSFADEVAAGQHTIVSLSGPIDLAAKLSSALASKEFVITPCADAAGVQIAGVFKNVAAILCGAANGLGAGANARAALMSEAIREAAELVIASGGDQATLLGPAGLGDFALTCTDAKSRNYRLGRALATGGGETATQEGAANAAALLQRACEQGVEVPLVEAVVELVEGRIDAAQAVQSAFARRLEKTRETQRAA